MLLDTVNCEVKPDHSLLAHWRRLREQVEERGEELERVRARQEMVRREVKRAEGQAEGEGGGIARAETPVDISPRPRDVDIVLADPRVRSAAGTSIWSLILRLVFGIGEEPRMIEGVPASPGHGGAFIL